MRLKKEAGENVEHNYRGSAANYQPACSVCALANGTQTPVEIKLARKDVFYKFSQLKFPTGECHEQCNLYRRFNRYRPSHP